jgi:carboxyl-terminal processing protease
VYYTSQLNILLNCKQHQLQSLPLFATLIEDMLKKKLNIWMPTLVSLVFVAGLIVGYLVSGNNTNGFFGKRNNALQEVYNLVNNKYVDSLQTDSITGLAIDELLSHLDPHSVYIPPKYLASVNEEMEGGFYGLGVTFEVINDTINITRVLKNGPAFESGIEVGDKILMLNDSIKLHNKNLSDDAIRKYMRGPEGSTMKMQLVRNGKLVTQFSKRGLVPIPSIDAAYIIAPQTGYIKINKFAERTYEEFMQSLEELQKQKIDKLVLDLRGNGGGFLHAASAIADEFLDGDKMIVYTKGLHTDKEEYKCQKEGLYEKGKLVVLIDENSASASEILAGALQDWDRATIIGRRSFGKGLVQQQYNLSNGGALRLTIARYYSPLGRNIQKPYDKGLEQYEEDLDQRYLRGELTVADSSKPKGPSFKTAKGHIVYGGGGIMPDYFIPYDTTKIKSLATKLYYSNTLNKYAYNYYLQQKANLVAAKNVASIQKNIVVNSVNWGWIQQEAVNDSISYSSISEKEKQEVVLKLQAILSRQIISNSSYYEVLNTNDAIITKALEVLK